MIFSPSSKNTQPPLFMLLIDFKCVAPTGLGLSGLTCLLPYWRPAGAICGAICCVSNKTNVPLWYLCVSN